MNSKDLAEAKAVSFMLRGMVAEAEAEAEFEIIRNALAEVRDKYIKGTEKEQVAFIAAATTFMIEMQDSL